MATSDDYDTEEDQEAPRPVSIATSFTHLPVPLLAQLQGATLDVLFEVNTPLVSPRTALGVNGVDGGTGAERNDVGRANAGDTREVGRVASSQGR